jgi:hypothetical protein
MPLSDRGQGLNHCICDVSHLLDAILRVRASETTFKQAISAYDEEIVPRGCEEVKCSLENGYMLHDWQKVKQSPVFTNGFKPMTGHDGKEALSEHAQVQLKMEEEARKAKHVADHDDKEALSEHAQVQLKMEEAKRVQIAAN